jgi:integrase
MSVRQRKWTTAKGAEREAWIVDYVDQRGTRRLKTFLRKKDAVAFETTMRGEVREGTHVPDRETVPLRQAGEEWLESCRAAGLEPTTIDQYRQHLKLHIEPLLGGIKLSQLSVPGVRAFQDRLRKEGRSDAMIKRVTVSLGSILADAQERGRISRNVVREMVKGRARGKARQSERRQKPRLQVGVGIPTPAEIRAIVENVKGRWRPLLITAIFTGMRASELRGLRWSDVDLKHARIHVRQRADRYHTIGMPKSDAGQRAIPVSPIVVNTLREWKRDCPEGKLDLVFPTGAGNVEAHPNIVARGYGPTQVAAGVVNDAGGAKYPGLHALRHFYASWCINPPDRGGLGLSPKEVQERLGHSSIMMTMDVYGHLFPKNDDSAALAEAESRLLAAV